MSITRSRRIRYLFTHLWSMYWPMFTCTTPNFQRRIRLRSVCGTMDAASNGVLGIFRTLTETFVFPLFASSFFRCSSTAWLSQCACCASTSACCFRTSAAYRLVSASSCAFCCSSFFISAASARAAFCFSFWVSIFSRALSSSAFFFCFSKFICCCNCLRFMASCCCANLAFCCTSIFVACISECCRNSSACISASCFSFSVCSFVISSSAFCFCIAKFICCFCFCSSMWIFFFCQACATFFFSVSTAFFCSWSSTLCFRTTLAIFWLYLKLTSTPPWLTVLPTVSTGFVLFSFQARLQYSPFVLDQSSMCSPAQGPPGTHVCVVSPRVHMALSLKSMVQSSKTSTAAMPAGVFTCSSEVTSLPARWSISSSLSSSSLVVGSPSTCTLMSVCFFRE
mmetsp:Transcript_4541/g.11075  ORF Transcript_4541/g.11075 Transcript_4541/m.11075 type:complete len:396 (-) Transcript_4541:349-1536(-)